MLPRALQVFYGGTFDPVHNGHLAVAREVRDGLGADVLLVPAADPPHKGPPQATAEQRAQLCELAVAGEPGISVDRRELRRPGPSYTLLTLQELRSEQGPDAAIAWLIGSDSLAGLAAWHRWRELFPLAHLLVVERPGTPVDLAWLRQRAPTVAAEVEARECAADRLAAEPAGRIARFALHELRPESSTALRRRIGEGDADWDAWVPEGVAAYIRRHCLYAGPHAPSPRG